VVAVIQDVQHRPARATQDPVRAEAANLVRRWQIKPRQVVVEGLCFAGKTTLTQALIAARAPGAVRVPEYADWADLPLWPPSDAAVARAGLDRLVGLEQRRLQWAAASGAEMAVFDRGPLSLVAHEVAMAAGGVPADPEHATAVCSRLRAPWALIYLDVPEALARDREQQRGRLPAHLASPRVRRWLRAYYERALLWVDERRVLRLDGDLPLPQMVEAVRAHLLAVPDGPPGLWDLPSTVGIAEQPSEPSGVPDVASPELVAMAGHHAEH